jgi:hypothetical protein
VLDDSRAPIGRSSRKWRAHEKADCNQQPAFVAFRAADKKTVQDVPAVPLCSECGIPTILAWIVPRDSCFFSAAAESSIASHRRANGTGAPCRLCVSFRHGCVGPQNLRFLSGQDAADRRSADAELAGDLGFADAVASQPPRIGSHSGR